MSAVMPESMALLLQKYSPEQIAEVVDAVMKMHPAASQRTAITSTAPISAITERKKRAKKTIKKVAQAQAQTSPRASDSIAPTRPLNSWMAFRSYHSPIFKSFQQKDISGFLTRMWQNDPFKAKWSILAKAYSIIRESNTKSAAPLDKFLALTCPHIGIIPRDDYLGVMGWGILDNTESGIKSMERLYSPEIASFPENILTTNLSSEDVVAYCYSVSFVQQNDNIARNQGSTATLTMAAQPSSDPSHFPVSAQPTSMGVDTPSSDSSSPASVQYEFGHQEAQQDQQDDHDYFLGGVQAQSAMEHMTNGSVGVQAALDFNNNGAVGASGPVRQTIHDLSSQQYPFMDEFDPFASSALTFDPFSMNHDAAFASNSASTYLAPNNNEFPETFNIDDLLSSDLFDLTK